MHGNNKQRKRDKERDPASFDSQLKVLLSSYAANYVGTHSSEGKDGDPSLLAALAISFIAAAVI